MLRAAMDDTRAELQAAEEGKRRRGSRRRASGNEHGGCRLRGFGDLADELEAHAVTANHDCPMAFAFAKMASSVCWVALGRSASHTRHQPPLEIRDERRGEPEIVL